MAQGLHAPALGLNTIIFKYVYWYMKQISGERLQDHWSSGIFSPILLINTALDTLKHNCELTSKATLQQLEHLNDITIDRFDIVICCFH